MNAEVLQAMGSASKALKSAHNNMDVDKVSMFSIYLVCFLGSRSYG